MITFFLSTFSVFLSVMAFKNCSTIKWIGCRGNRSINPQMIRIDEQR